MRITNTDALEITTQSVEAMSVAIAARSAHAPGSIEQGPPAPFNSQEEVEVWLRERRAQGKAGILSRIIAHEKKKLSEFEVIQDEVNAMRVKNRIKELQEQLVKLSTT